MAAMAGKIGKGVSDAGTRNPRKTNWLLPFWVLWLTCIFIAVQKMGARLSANAYEATRKNLKINKNTKVICQGFTGKQVGNKRFFFVCCFEGGPRNKLGFFQWFSFENWMTYFLICWKNFERFSVHSGLPYVHRWVGVAQKGHAPLIAEVPLKCMAKNCPYSFANNLLCSAQVLFYCKYECTCAM